MIVKREGTRPGMLRVTFQLPNTLQADSVQLVGDFITTGTSTRSRSTVPTATPRGR